MNRETSIKKLYAIRQKYHSQNFRKLNKIKIEKFALLVSHLASQLIIYIASSITKTLPKKKIIGFRPLKGSFLLNQF